MASSPYLPLFSIVIQFSLVVSLLLRVWWRVGYWFHLHSQIQDFDVVSRWLCSVWAWVSWMCRLLISLGDLRFCTSLCLHWKSSEKRHIWGAVLSSLNFRWKRVRCRLVLVMKLRFCNELFVYACCLCFFVTDWPYVALAWSWFLTIGPTLQWLLVIRVGWIVWLEAWWQLWRLFSFLRVVSLEVGVPPCLSLKKLYMSFWFSGCKRSRLKSLEITILSFSSERRYYQLESLPHVTIVYCLAEKWIRV